MLADPNAGRRPNRMRAPVGIASRGFYYSSVQHVTVCLPFRPWLLQNSLARSETKQASDDVRVKSPFERLFSVGKLVEHPPGATTRSSATATTVFLNPQVLGIRWVGIRNKTE